MAITPLIDDAIAQAHAELDQIRQVKKCTSCECLLDVLHAIRTDLADFADMDSAKESAEATLARADFQSWEEAGNVKRHRCPGCEPCLPIAPYNQFNAAFASAGMGVGMSGAAQTTGSCAGGSCGCEGGCAPMREPAQETQETQETQDVTIRADDAALHWPVVEGNYVVGDPAAPVALCTLADEDLLGELKSSGVTARVAISGTLTTENLGVEHVLHNLTTNPSIRTLILCGRDSRGHHAGQALLALKQSGIDAQRRVVGALGARAVLKNVTDAQIEAFRERITLVDEIGIQDVARISRLATAYLAKETPNRSGARSDAGLGNSSGAALEVLPPRRPAPKVVEARAQERREWVHDSEGFFVVLLDREPGVIVCEHYTKAGVHDETIRGAHAADLANTAVRRGLLSRLDHAAYLGRELAKAEVALALNLPYTQDAALGVRER